MKINTWVWFVEHPQSINPHLSNVFIKIYKVVVGNETQIGYKAVPIVSLEYQIQSLLKVIGNKLNRHNLCKHLFISV